jgi:hypothetical protein
MRLETFGKVLRLRMQISIAEPVVLAVLLALRMDLAEVPQGRSTTGSFVATGNRSVMDWDGLDRDQSSME